jgi:flagellar basal-body rod modification protein FlgD
MSNIALDTILATQSATDAASTTLKSTDKVSAQKDMFLRLLVKQLQYQDPMNPVENTEFTAQLAQFSSLEALTDMNDSIEQMTKYQNSMNSMQAVSFIGKKVSASGNTINYTGGDSSIDFNLESLASEVDVTIYNSQGTVVRTIEMQNVQKGDIKCTWDGKGDNGESLGPGTYYFSIKATDYSGVAVKTSTYANGTVTGVRYDNGMIYLQVGDKEVSLADVTEISE